MGLWDFFAFPQELILVYAEAAKMMKVAWPLHWFHYSTATLNHISIIHCKMNIMNLILERIFQINNSQDLNRTINFQGNSVLQKHLGGPHRYHDATWHSTMVTRWCTLRLMSTYTRCKETPTSCFRHFFKEQRRWRTLDATWYSPKFVSLAKSIHYCWKFKHFRTKKLCRKLLLLF